MNQDTVADCTVQDTRDQQDAKAGSRLAAYHLLAMLLLAYIISAVDRQIIALMVEPIKEDLGLSDSQIGAVQGFGFLIVYALAAIPAGFLLDRYRRVWIIGGAMALWSVMTGMCGLASSFWQLFATRAGVGIGEAVLTPAAYSLIPDRFPARQLTFALGVYTCGAVLVAACAYLFGGMLYHEFSRVGDVRLLGYMFAPWQMTFIALTFPGLLIAILFAVTAEPSRAHSPEKASGSHWSTMSGFFRSHRKVLILHHFSVSMGMLVVTIVTTWSASFFVRKFDMSVSQAGAWLSGVTIVSGLLGLLGGGAMADIVFRYGAHHRLWLSAALALTGALCCVGLMADISPTSAAVLIAVAQGSISATTLIGGVALQTLMPGEIRASVTAMYFAVINLIGSIGPSLVGYISDRLSPRPDALSIAYSATTTGGFLLCCLGFCLTVRPYRRAISLQPANNLLESKQRGR